MRRAPIRMDLLKAAQRIPLPYRAVIAGAGLVAVLVLSWAVAASAVREVGVRQDAIREMTALPSTLDHVLALTKDVQINVRSYLGTGDPQFMDQYRAAADGIHAELDRLDRLVVDDPLSHQHLQALRDRADALVAQTDAFVQLRQQRGEQLRPLDVMPLRSEQDQLVAALREHAATLRRAQDAALAVREQRLRQAQRNQTLFLLLPSLISVLLAAILSLLVVRELRRREALERERSALLDHERQAREEAEASSQAKDDFVSMISHELRTPLQAILGWTQLLKRTLGAGEAPPSGQSPLTTIERNARLLAGMIDDLLDVSRAITGRISLHLVRVDLVEILRFAVETAQPAALAKRLTLRLELDAETLPMIGDADRLRQVAVNLIGNAVKFTPVDGHITVAAGHHDSRLQVTVRDDGIGITPEMLPRVFDRYMQGSASTNRQYGGLGLGLAIVKHFVELHGGTVSAASAGAGRGAEFTLRFTVPALDSSPLPYPETPVAATAGRSALPRADAEPQPATAPRLGGLVLLVVDDDEDVRLVLQTLLEDEGATVHVAASAPSALELLRRVRMDAVLSDIGMPGVDGYMFARSVRSGSSSFSASATTTPMIALTAFSRDEDRQRALSVGFDAHLGKPVETERLIAAVLEQVGPRNRPGGRRDHVRRLR